MITAISRQDGYTFNDLIEVTMVVSGTVPVSTAADNADEHGIGVQALCEELAEGPSGWACRPKSGALWSVLRAGAV